MNLEHMNTGTQQMTNGQIDEWNNGPMNLETWLKCLQVHKIKISHKLNIPIAFHVFFIQWRWVLTMRNFSLN